MIQGCFGVWFFTLIQSSPTLEIRSTPTSKLGSASDWLCCVVNLLQPIKKHYPDLGSDALSVWNFCTLFSDIYLWGKPVVASPNFSCFLRLQQCTKLDTSPQLFKRWIALSCESISIQWIVQLVSLILAH